MEKAKDKKKTNKNAKYIFVTGGVVSGLGKGITAASIGRMLRNRGLSVTIQKLDPYLNVDPGTMNPYRHGEVFVTDDGTETDLDIGHYERFLDVHCSRLSSSTMGKVYTSVLERERKGEYLGRDVQVVPHVTDEIKSIMRSVAQNNDIVIVEVGGTVGEIEGMTYIEAIRQFRKELGPQGSASVHVTLVPYLEASKEIKTKPTQNSFRDLASMGIYPDVIVCRTGEGVELDNEAKEKISLFCNLESVNHVVHNKDCRSIYEVPLLLKEQKLDDLLLKVLGLRAPADNMGDWRKMVEKMLVAENGKTVAIVGKYVAVPDSYISVTEAIKAAAMANGVRVCIKLVDSEDVEKVGAEKALAGACGIVVPGGFGDRGVEGKIATAKYARENNIPFVGVCLGMQLAVVEFARNVAGLKGANSTEIDAKTPHPVVDVVRAGKMRLGLYDCFLTKGTKAYNVYKNNPISERHRHRYKFNNKYREQLEKSGLVIAGINEETNIVEIIEVANHPYFVAAQFHPELLSKPYKPHPLFVGLVGAMLK